MPIKGLLEILAASVALVCLACALRAIRQLLRAGRAAKVMNDVKTGKGDQPELMPKPLSRAS